jgi:phosphopantothenoylcysteine decarboxylase
MADDTGTSSAPRARRRPRVLLGLTGSVAAVKWHELVLALSAHAEVRVVHTESAAHFMGLAAGYNEGAAAAYAAAVAAGGEGAPAVLSDAAEWRAFTRVHADPVLHIELRKWADAALLAPLSANTLAKLAAGMCDNLLTSILRAWEFTPAAAAAAAGAAPAAWLPAKPLLVAPAMNTAMWAHPLTAAHLATLAGLGYTIVPPVPKVLACGDVGNGAMAAVADIVAALLQALAVAPHEAAAPAPALEAAVAAPAAPG